MPSFLVECKTKMAAPCVDQQRNAAGLPSALWPNDKIAKIDLNCSLCCCCSSCLCLPPPPASSHHPKHHHHSPNHSSHNSVTSFGFIFLPFICFIIFIIQSVHGHHWPSLQAAQARFPGCCPLPESFDCGNGTCLSVSRFHDGQIDCHDGSDEFCLPGQIPCGQFCADLLHLGECLRNPNCTKEQQQKEGTDQQNLPMPPIFCPLLKRRLCGVANTISCRGYGECIFVKWLMDGKRDCLDGSDEDAEYAGLFKVTPVREDAEIDEKEKGHPKGPQSSASPLPPGAKSGERTSSRVQSKSTTMRMRTPSKWREGEGQGGGNWPEEEDWSKESPMDGDESKFGVGNGRRTTIMMGRGGGGKEEDGRGRKEENGGKLKLVESTEPGPWQNPPLDDFGGEFARFLITPSTTNPTIKTTTTITQNAKSRLMTGAAGPSDKHIIFPNWPEEEKEEREWKKEHKGGGNWPMTTPKYPFDRGKIVGREEEMKSAEEGGGEGGAEAPIWVPIPFSRPATRTTRTTERTTTKRGEGGKEWKWKTIEGGGWRNNKEDEEEEKEKEKEEFDGTTQKTEIWLPEILGGKLGVKEEEEERKQQMKEGNEEADEYEEQGRGRKPVEEVISEEEETKKHEGKEIFKSEEAGKKEKGMKEEEEEEEIGRKKTTGKNEEEEEMESTTLTITPIITTTTTTEELSPSASPSTALPSPSIPALSSIHPPLPIHPAEIMPMPKTHWLMPITDAALSSAIASMSGPQAALLNCTQRVLRIMDQLAPSQSATRCQCPVGQMRQANGQCQMAPISTFRARLDSLCGIRKLDFLPEEQLVFLKTAASIRDRPICIRDVLDGPLIVMNSMCEAENNCSIDEMNQKANAPDVPLPEIKLKIGELSGDACGHFDLNDCEEKAECIPQGLRYQCRCLPGTNDTLPQHPGRFCDGTVISKSCVKFLGVCVLVWLLMLLLLCILLPTIGYFCLKHCYKKSPTTQEAVERRWRWLKGKILRKEPSLLPIITTSTAPSGSQRRESGAAGTEMAGADFGHTLKVPSMIEGQKPSYIIPPVRQQTQTDSEEYLIMEEDEEGGAEGEIVPDEERDQIKRDSSEKTEEEGAGGGTGGKVTKSQTLDEEEAEAISQELGGRKGTEMRMEEEEGKKEAEKEGGEQPATEPAPETGRPPSVTSRAGTPTIWDQFRILGDQYSRMVNIEERRESKNSLEELMNKAKERERAEDAIRRKEERREVEELDETIKDDLDAELKMAGGGRDEREEQDEEADKGGEGGLRMEVGRGRWRGAVDGEEEPGRSIPTLGPGLLPPGAIRIGFGGFHDYDSEDLDMAQRARRRIGGQLPPPTSTTSPPQLPRRQFVPKQLGARHPPMGRTLTSVGSTIVKGPAPAAATVADGQRRVAKGEFVVIRGRRVEERKREKKERAEAEERRDKRKRIMGQMRQQQRVAEEESTERPAVQREFPRPRDPRVGEEFDPDLPTTSQAEPHWQKSLRHPRPAGGEHSAEYLRQRFRQHQQHGQALASIEEQIEKRVHSGCIVGGRKPWDVSPRADQLQQEWMGRELTQSDYGLEGDGRERSLERIESRVHSGCITDRKPWNSSTWKPDGDNIQRGHSDWDLSTRRKHKESEEEKQMRETTRIHGKRKGTSSLERRKGETGNEQKWLEYD